jgi:iron complex outermembrane receptor protein
MQQKGFGLLSLMIAMFLFTAIAISDDSSTNQGSQETGETINLGEISIQAQKLKDNIELSPEKININLDNYQKAGTPHSIIDILKDRAIIDFRGRSGLTNENDDIQMRGFDTRQFTTALDGLAIQKTGGYWGGHFVDYSFIPLEQIERIEIFPGPHSALYEGKSFGGALNIVTKSPKFYEKPDVKFTLLTSYGSLNTNDNNISMAGGGGAMNYLVSFRKYHTDGYLKNSQSDLTNFSTKLSWWLPSDGYFSVLGIYSDKSNKYPCVNDPDTDFYDSSYPTVLNETVSSRWRDPSMDSGRNKYAHSLRFDLKQPSELGTWSMGAYYAYEDQRYIKKEWGANMKPNDTWWVSYGAKIQNDVLVLNDHTISFGCDFANLNRRYATEIVRTFAVFIQDQWQITPSLKFIPGFRYEDITIWWSNYSTRGGAHYINPDDPRENLPRQYDNLIPKAFVSYSMDDLNPMLKDTDISLGLSRIWTPRANCEVCTWGSGIEQESTKGYAVDLIFQRKLSDRIDLMLDLSHYNFDNYVIFADGSTDYYRKSPWYRRMIGLQGVKKNGIEMEINGDVTNDLSMNLSFAYVDWKYTNSKAGSIEDMSANRLSDRAKYRLNAGLTYNINDQLQFHMDYYHQDKQVKEILDVIDEEAGLFDIREVHIDSYGVVDTSVTYILFDRWHRIEKPTLKLYCNNLLDADYVNLSGYPATEQTFGISLTSNF